MTSYNQTRESDSDSGPYDKEIRKVVSDVFDDELLRRLEAVGVEGFHARGIAQHARNYGLSGEVVVELVEEELKDSRDNP